MFFFRLTLAAIVAALPQVAIGAGGFLATCTHPMLRGSVLSADCINGGGGSGVSSLDLNGCLNNNNGQLVYQLGGGAFGSCNGCTLGGSELTCSCVRANQQTDFSSINLNDYVGNNDGILGC